MIQGVTKMRHVKKTLSVVMESATKRDILPKVETTIKP